MRITLLLPLIVFIFSTSCFELSTLGSECDSSNDCDEAQNCVDQRCSLDDDFSCDCDDDEICRDNRCQPCTPELCDECVDDGFCNDNETCLDGLCVEFVECNEDNECGLQQRCVDNFCVEDIQCEQDFDCGELARCENGQCLSTDCRLVEVCSDESFCDEESGLCVESGCLIDSECAFNEVCDQGTCVEFVCASNDECENNFECIEGDCVEAQSVSVVRRERDYILGSDNGALPQSDFLCAEGEIVVAASGRFAFAQGYVSEVTLACANVAYDEQNFSLIRNGNSVNLIAQNAAPSIAFENGDVECGVGQVVIGFRAAFSTYQFPGSSVLFGLDIICGEPDFAQRTVVRDGERNVHGAFPGGVEEICENGGVVSGISGLSLSNVDIPHFAFKCSSFFAD